MFNGNCSLCERESDLFVGWYQHPNGEQYSMALCDECKPNQEKWRITHVKQR